MLGMFPGFMLYLTIMNLGHAKIMCIFPRSGASIILKYRIKGLEKIFRERPVQLLISCLNMPYCHK